MHKGLVFGTVCVKQQNLFWCITAVPWVGYCSVNKTKTLGDWYTTRKIKWLQPCCKQFAMWFLRLNDKRKSENRKTTRCQWDWPAVDMPPDEDLCISTEYCAYVYKSRKMIITMLWCVSATGSQNHGLCWTLKKHVPSKQVKAPTCLSYTLITAKHVWISLAVYSGLIMTLCHR